VFSWIHTDRLGTPLAVTSTPASGPAKVIWRAIHEPFGLATPDEDPDGDSQSFALDLRFPGQVFDAESGVHYNYFRQYDPRTGRYAESDPIGLASGSTNTFAYVDGNPIEMIDPIGLQVIPRSSCDGQPLCWTEHAQPVSPTHQPLPPVVPPIWTSPDEQADPDAGTQSGGGCPPKDPCKGLRDQLAKHQAKLDAYRSNPYAYDNQGHLARNPARRHPQIISHRVGKLQRQIDNFKKQLEACERKHGIHGS
jgi:RHS repeat-associated protein